VIEKAAPSHISMAFREGNFQPDGKIASSLIG